MKLTKCGKYLIFCVLSLLLLVGAACKPAPKPGPNTTPVVTQPPVTGVVTPPNGGNALPGNTTGNVVSTVPGNTPPGNASANVPAMPSLMPTLVIISPADGASVPRGNVTVVVQTTRFFFPTDPSGRHIHYYLDVEAPNIPGQPAIPAGGVWAQSFSSDHTFPNVSPGSHTISVQLVNHDHTPLNPNIVAKITINVTVGN